MVAWAFHRISGVGIFAFILLHIVDIYLVGANPQLYDDVLAFYASFPGRLLEVLLERRCCTTRSTACAS